MGQQITPQFSGPVSEVNSEKVARTTTLSVYTSQVLLQAVMCKDKVQIFKSNIHWPFSSLNISIMLIKFLKQMMAFSVKKNCKPPIKIMMCLNFMICR